MPSEAALAAVEDVPIGTGDPNDEYYMYIAARPAAVSAGDARPALVESLGTLRATLLASARDTWLQRGRFPVGFGDCTRAQLTGTLRRGRIHCLVWSATGDGWECRPLP